MIKRIYFVLFLVFLINTVHSQYEFPAGNYWSLDGGFGMSDILVEGAGFQFIIDPKLWISPSLMVGNRIAVNYSTDNILTFETQAYLRWNFIRLGNTDNPINLFAQAGIGVLAAYRGWDNPFDDAKRRRGSLLFDAASGVTIPLTQRWHIEPSIRVGYPHVWGFSIIAGFKFPLPQSSARMLRSTIVRNMPPAEIIKMVVIHSVEFVIFGPDIGRYNVGIDSDAQALNELVLNSIAQVLRENPDFRVRIEGHANPATPDSDEANELMALSAMRAYGVSAQLRAKGVRDDQIVIIAYGGTRSVTRDHDISNRNRRVELMIIQIDPN
jgi:hypothetical protein